MIKIENVLTPSGEIWEAVIYGMRNPFNSWEKSDSGRAASWEDEFDMPGYITVYEDRDCVPYDIGPADQKLMRSLANGGSDDRKFLRMLPVYLDIVAPLYWWKEFDTYKVGTVANSCSTMHKIAENEFTLEDFSWEHLYSIKNNAPSPSFNGVQSTSIGVLQHTITALNFYREYYLSMVSQKVPGSGKKAKELWWQMIQLLPSSYNQRRTVMLNYEVLKNMYHARKNHKLDEWREFCAWIETLPFSELITGIHEEGCESID